MISRVNIQNGQTEVSQNLYINHSLWWAWAAVMWMGCEVAPKALSTRFIAGMWYLFTLIMVSSYTANLAASLTAENLHNPISSATVNVYYCYCHKNKTIWYSRIFFTKPRLSMVVLVEDQHSNSSRY